MNCCCEGMNVPLTLPSMAFLAAIFVSAAPKISCQPPNFDGR